MAGKHTFSYAERFGVWFAFDSRCFWCGQPLEFTHTTVDHVIPEIYESKPGSLAEIKLLYGLSDDFQINDFCNWVPAHARCNSTKNDALYAPSPIFLKILHDVSKRAKTSRQKTAQIKRDNRRSNIIARLGSALEEGTVSRDEVMQLVATFNPMPDEATTLESITYLLSPTWKVIRTEGNLVYMATDKGVGYTTALENPDTSWLCPGCGLYGPWSGSMCLNCGLRSEPD